MKWLGHPFGKLYVGDRVEVIAGVYKIGYDLGLKNQFKYGTITYIFRDKKIAILQVEDHVGRSLGVRHVNLCNLKRVK